MKYCYHLLLCCMLLTAVCYSQTPQAVKIIVAPDRLDWTYKTGDKVKFTVMVLKNGNPLPDTKIVYEYGQEKMTPLKVDSVILSNGKLVIDAGTLKNPGFLRCIVTANVEGFKYRGLATAGFNPADIQPTVTLPSDFQSFWDKSKEELAKVPMDARMRLLPDRCTGNVNVYELSLGNINNSRFYGILCMPKKEGKYPALCIVPGAGVRSYNGEIGLAEKGIITLQVGIHGIPVTMEEHVYASLREGALKGYPIFNIDDKHNYYYKRVYMGCVRANDFLASLPQYDGEHLGVTGGSQGGALSIITAALDKRVKYVAAYYPALADVTGYLSNRAGGWPALFTNKNIPVAQLKEKIETVAYYDVVNFSKSLKAEGVFAWGYNDETCPPTSMFAAYNCISAPKQLWLALETGHAQYPETTLKMNNWLVEKLIAK